MSLYPASNFGPRAVNTERLYNLIAKAGAKGCSMAELKAATGMKGLQIGGLLHNLTGRNTRRVLLQAVPVYGKLARYFLATVPAQTVQLVAMLEGERLKAEALIRAKAKEKARKAAYRQANRQRNATQAEQRKREREAEKARVAEIAKAAAAVRRLDAAAKKATRHRPMTALKRGEHALTNAYAAKIKSDGTRGPAPAEKPAPVITWPEHIVIQKAKPTPDRYAVGEVPKLFSAKPLGQYLSEAA